MTVNVKDDFPSLNPVILTYPMRNDQEDQQG